MVKDVMKKVMKEVEVYDGEIITCDCCNKDIYDSTKKEKYLKGFASIKLKYFSLATGHHDWGNDSIDSKEYFECCSKECLMETIEKFLDKNKDSYTAHFEMSTEEIYVSK